jgi:CRISPR-associated protein Cmr3
MSITIEISPLDTLFFKNAKPFDAGDNSWSDGMFFPNPSTIYGALRAIYFRNNPDKFKYANIKGKDPTEKLIIKKIFFNLEDNYYFPLPSDMVYEKGDETKDSYILEEDGNIPISNIKSQSFLSLKDLENIEKFENALLSIDDFKEYQCRDTGEFIASIKELNNFILNEPKVGIKINKTFQTVEEGYLYRIDFRRFETIDEYQNSIKVKIVVEFEGLDIKKSKIIRLGGEGKMATIQYIDNIEVKEPQNIEKNFKLYFLTPAIFDNGWLPSWIDKNSLVGEYKGVKLKLLTASIGKYKLIGGFDMKKNRPKPMYRAVPEGSVYYFEILKGNLDDIKNKFHNQSISDKLKNEGYGITFVGAVR